MDDEHVSEAALVRRMRRAQCRVGRGVRAVGEFGQRLGGQCLGEVARRQVVGRLVRRGQEGVQVRVGAVVGEAAGPAEAAQAGQERALGVRGRLGVEPLQARRRRTGRLGARPCRYGELAGEMGETVRRQRESSGVLDWRVRRVRRVLGVPLTLSRVVSSCPTDV